MAKRITLEQKEEITKLFISGISLDLIAEQFNFTKLTISRNLKNNLGEIAYKELLAVSKSNDKLNKNKKHKINDLNTNATKDKMNASNYDLNKMPNEDVEEEF